MQNETKITRVNLNIISYLKNQFTLLLHVFQVTQNH